MRQIPRHKLLGAILADVLTLDEIEASPISGGTLAWIVCLSAGLFFFYEFFQLNIFDVINQPLRQTFHLNATQVSWMSSNFLWADILFLLPAGIILDRFSARKVILASMLICVGSTAGFALATSYMMASVCHFFAGIGNAFCFLACVVLVTRWFPTRRQALVIGCVVTMAFLGGMMAHAPFTRLTNQYGWRNALLIDAMVGVGLLLWIYAVVKDSPTAQRFVSAKNNPHVLPTFLRSLCNRQTLLAGLYTSALNLPIMVLCALWGASYLQTVHHLPEMAASKIVSLIFIGSIVGCPLVGWLSDNQGKRKPLMLAGALATLLTTIPFFLDVSLSSWQLSALFFALGLFTSTQVISYPLIAESNAAASTGAATAIASVIIMGGGGVGQVVFGWLMQQHAGTVNVQYNVADFQYAMWMFPLTALFALVAVLLTKETNCQRLV